MCLARNDGRYGQIESNIEMSLNCVRHDAGCGQVISKVPQIGILSGCGQTTRDIEMTLMGSKIIQS